MVVRYGLALWRCVWCRVWCHVLTAATAAVAVAAAMAAAMAVAVAMMMAVVVAVATVVAAAAAASIIGGGAGVRVRVCMRGAAVFDHPHTTLGRTFAFATMADHKTILCVLRSCGELCVRCAHFRLQRRL